MVDFGGMAGGVVETTWWRVSRMEVREGMMKAPEVVVSQYCLFCLRVRRGGLFRLGERGGDGMDGWMDGTPLHH